MHVDMQAGTRTCARTHRHEHRWISTGLHIYLAICLPFDPCNHPLIYHSTQQLICPICPSIRLPIYQSPTYLFTHLPFYLSTYLPTYPPIYLSTYLPAYLRTYRPTYLLVYLLTCHLSICPPTYLSVCLPTYLPAYLPTYLLPTYLPTCLPGPAYLSIHPSTFLSMYLSF